MNYIIWSTIWGGIDQILTIKLTTCRECKAKFKVKNIDKPYVGAYEGKPVFHHHYKCSKCGCIHTVRLYNEEVNEYYDRLMGLEFLLIIERKNEEKYNELKKEYDKAKGDLDRINSDVMKMLSINP